MNVPETRMLSQQEFESLCHGAKVLEQDARGMKVLQLPHGDILKLFRVKRKWSSAQLVPYSRRFCRNAIRLSGLGVPTLTVKACFRLPADGLTAVLYQPLPGRTLRQIAQEDGLDEGLQQQLGVLVADLHRHGIYFRSLHLGNLVRTPEGTIGLIDIADLSIKPWRLFCSQRLRNLRHLCRLAEDRKALGQRGWQRFCEAYLEAAQLTGFCRQLFIKRAPATFHV
jgi:tRNA A-37 threonylcarbamoyl transferase component Bud32